MNILLLMARLYFMAFQKDGDTVCEITQTYVSRSHVAPMLTKAKTVTDAQ